MSLWTNVDAADTADTTGVTINTTSGSKLVTTGSTTSIKRHDQITGTGIPANSTVTKVVNTTDFLISRAATATGSPTNAAFVHKNVAKPKYQTVAEQKITYGVDVNEIQLKPYTHTGWVKVTPGSGARSGRFSYETIVAMGSMGLNAGGTAVTSDAEDTAYPDPTITISAGPTASTVRAYSGVSSGSPVSLPVTLSVTALGAVIPTYQWKSSATIGGSYTNVAPGAGVSGVTSNTLVRTALTKNSQIYYKLAITAQPHVGSPLTALSSAAFVVGAQQMASTTWTSGFVSMDMTAPHDFVIGDTVTLAGFTPGTYNGVHVLTAATTPNIKFNLATDPGTCTGFGTVTRNKVISTATWITNVATINTSTPHELVNGDIVTITGVSVAGYNVTTGAITTAGASSFTYALVIADPGPATGGNAAYNQTAAATPAWTSNMVNTTVTGHGFTNGAVVVSGAVPSGYNGTVTIVTDGTDAFHYPVAGTLAAVTVEGVVYQ